MLFGTKDQAALIHCHNAFPTSATVGIALRVDVMTPHYHGYNENTSTLQASRGDFFWKFGPRRVKVRVLFG
ncbi:MAG: hypothetical protein ACFWT6_08195 [Virgibacillus proomii]|jgi:CRISPR/Cas system CMR subunit Cmr6 (Cas7 group RAMP superfamily)